MRNFKFKNQRSGDRFLALVCLTAVLIAVLGLLFQEFTASLMTSLIGLLFITRIFFAQFLNDNTKQEGKKELSERDIHGFGD